MASIRVTKEFRFEMAHALLNYDGPCRNIHGHSYILLVTVCGTPSQQAGKTDDGMVIDFGALKKLVQHAVIDRLDHALVLNDATPREILDGLSAFQNIVLLPYQPTCENMLPDLAARIRALLPSSVSLHSLRLHETATSYAEWFAADNP